MWWSKQTWVGGELGKRRATSVAISAEELKKAEFPAGERGHHVEAMEIGKLCRVAGSLQTQVRIERSPLTVAAPRLWRPSATRSANFVFMVGHVSCPVSRMCPARTSLLAAGWPARMSTFTLPTVASLRLASGTSGTTWALSRSWRRSFRVSHPLSATAMRTRPPQVTPLEHGT